MWTPGEFSRWERNVEAMVRSAGSNDPEAFALLVNISHWLDRYGLPKAYRLLQAQGYTVREIARPLEVTPQAAWAKYARR